MVLKFLGNTTMKKLIATIFVVFLMAACTPLPTADNVANLDNPEALDQSNQLLEEAFENQTRNLQIRGQGIVIKMLSDDLDGSQHQRFILELSSGQTLLVAHNIDLAPRINSLKVGDTVTFYGEYEWNPEGGVIHWTHHDPAGEHIGGWLQHDGRTYQ